LRWGPVGNGYLGINGIGNFIDSGAKFVREGYTVNGIRKKWSGKEMTVKIKSKKKLLKEHRLRCWLGLHDFYICELFYREVYYSPEPFDDRWRMQDYVRMECRYCHHDEFVDITWKEAQQLRDEGMTSVERNITNESGILI
jgi:hypothetical protein